MNAKEELSHIITARNLTILKIDIVYEHIDYDTSCGEYKTYTKGITSFNDLDFCYDNSYGIQELFGTVYCKDSNNKPVWLTREEYDGSEWWNINTIPKFYDTIK